MFTSKTPNVAHAIDVLKPCKVTYTSNSVYIESGGKSYIFTSSGNTLKPSELSFVKQFRSYYIKNKSLKYEKRFARFNPKFFKFYKESGNHNDIIEIDINRAYPSSGRILGIIPDELFDEGMRHSKTAFLVAVGSLYRKKKVIKVSASGVRELVSDEKPDAHLTAIWRSIVGYVDYSMQTAVKSNEDAVYFYWCDALFVKKQYAQHFIDQLEGFGFQVKTKEIDKVEYKEDKAYVYYTGIKEPKTFSRPVRKYTVKSIDQLIKRYEKKEK